MGWSDKLLRCLTICRVKSSCVCHLCKCSDCQSDCMKDNQLSRENSMQNITPQGVSGKKQSLV